MTAVRPLARIFHTLSATVRHMPVTTALRLVRVLDVLLEYACGLPAERDAPCIDRHLTHLATKQCEIPGPTGRLGQHPSPSIEWKSSSHSCIDLSSAGVGGDFSLERSGPPGSESHLMNPISVLSAAVLLLIAVCPSLIAGQAASHGSNRPNVLFIVVDDMADWCGCLRGHPDVRTPNIDRLAHRGLLFTEAHCVSPICGPSRASVLTGMRPETTGVYHNRGTYIDYVPQAVSLPQHFMSNGYHVMGAGKINHGMGMVTRENWHDYGPDAGIVGGPFTHEELKTEGMAPRRAIRRDRLNCELPMNGISLIDRPSNQYSTFDWGPVDLTDEAMPDGKIALWAVDQLQHRRDKPFFLAVGFYRPHQPFFVPRKYFEMYDPKRISLPPTIAGDLADLSASAKHLALLPWTSGCHDTVMRHNQWLAGVHGYLAAISFADAQVGRVIDALDSGPHADNTLIVLWSDHGWHLGQKEHWGKHTPWTTSTRVPLILVPPRNSVPDGFHPGRRSYALVTLLDLYPTLIDLCGLPTRSELEGRSLAPLLADPQRLWSDAAVTSVGRGTHSVRTHRWRYIRYYDGSEELYDLIADPYEWFNLAGNSEFAARKVELAAHFPMDKRLQQFVRWGRWKCVIPKEKPAMLFDLLAPHGISEQNDLASEYPLVVNAILKYVKEEGRLQREVTIPEDALGI